MKILAIGSDRTLFKEGSAARARIAQYGSIVDEYHIIVFSLRSHVLSQTKIADNVWVYPTNSFSRLLYVHDAQRVARTLGEFDLISAQDPFESGLAALQIARNKKTRLQVQLHTDPFSTYFTQESVLNRIRLMIAKRVLPKADCIRVVSRRIADGLRNAKLHMKKEPDVLPIFVDIAHITNTQSVFSLYEKYSQFNFIILMVSRISKEKRIDMALTAVAVLVQKYPKLGLVIVGDGPERAALALHAEKLGIKEYVVFEGWQEDLVSYYKTAGVYLLTSDYEGYGRTLVEAAAAGLPVVTTDVGLARELFVDGETAFVCASNDADCVVEKVSQVIEDNALRTRMSYTAKRKVTEGALTFEAYLARMKESFANCCRTE